jgi:hypothetical protein
MTRVNSPKCINLLVELQRECKHFAASKKDEVISWVPLLLHQYSELKYGRIAMTRNLDALGICASENIQGRISFRITSQPSNVLASMLQLGDQVDQAHQSLGNPN